MPEEAHTDVQTAAAEMAQDTLRNVYHVAMDNMELLFGGAEAVLGPIYSRVTHALFLDATSLEEKATEDAFASMPPIQYPQVPAGQGPAYRRQLGQRLLPQPEPRPLPRRRKFVTQPQQKTLSPYSAESLLFEQLVHESVSSKVSAAQMQYLLGVAVRAEPLWAEPALGCLGACSLPVRNDFFPWDSTLEAVKRTAPNWPCMPSSFDTNAKPPPVAPGVGGGLLEGQENPPSYEIGKPSTDPLAVFSRFWPVPGDREKAEALGPRLLRIRKLGGHPSLGLTPSGRCANAAFCVRPAIMADDTALGGPGLFKCTQCECAWYCSSACQSLHTTAHSFECQALRSLRMAANNFENRGLERTKRALAGLLEQVLAKQFSMVAKPEALIGCTALSEDLLSAIYGSAEAAAPQPHARDDAESDSGDEQSMVSSKRTTYSKAGAQVANRADDKDLNKMSKALRHGKLMEWTQMVVMPEDLKKWSVELELGAIDSNVGGHDRRSRYGASVSAARRSSTGLRGSDCNISVAGLQESAPSAGQVRTVPRGLFDVKQTHAHTAAGVVRLLLRWVGSSHRSPALREVIDNGFIFCLITGLCETHHFSKRRLSKFGVVSILAHRMALHVAASQQWRALAPSLAPPRQFQEDGLQGIECAQYTAYYCFLRPQRLPFAQLRPMLPIVCLVWGDAARNALLELPHKRETNNDPSLLKQPGSQPTSPSSQTHAHASLLDVEGLMDKPSASLQNTGGYPKKGAESLTSFLEVASDHLAQIQLIDSVNLDVLTGKVSFLAYTATVDTARAADADRYDQAVVLLLDASRGMQVIASPVPARELRRCAL